MKLLLDGGGKIDYDMIQADTTVKDLLEAIDIFLRENPLPCDNCEESCCKKAWSVEMDNVCVKRLSNWNEEAAVSFVQEKLIKKKNYYREFNQYVLRKEKDCIYITDSNLCTIYEKRPVICRLYICSPKSYRYNVLRELVGSTYLKALIYEQKMRTGNFTERTIKKYMANPAVLAKDYDILLEDVFTYAEAEGWIDCDERQELY